MTFGDFLSTRFPLSVTEIDSFRRKSRPEIAAPDVFPMRGHNFHSETFGSKQTHKIFEFALWFI